LNDTQVAKLKAELLQYPKNSNPTVSYGERRTLVVNLLNEISFLRDQDYSFAAISTILHEKADILIQPNTLKKYFFEELGKLKTDEKPTGQRHRKASPGRLKSRSSKATQPVDETIAASPVAVAAEPEPKARAKPDEIPAAPKPDETPVASPVATANQADDDDWGGDWDDGDDDSYTSGLLNEPTFNRIRRS
jgi:hypothetical protein